MTPLELVELHKFLLQHSQLATAPPKGEASSTALPNAIGTQINEAERTILQRAWISELHSKYLLARKVPAESFTRHKLCKGIYIFSEPGEKRSKTALVCFTGSAHRMMMPTPVFLQNLVSSNADIIYLRTKKGDGYRTGVVGLGDDLETSIQLLNTLIKRQGYGRVACIGVSAGGLPAIIAGLEIEADTVLSVGAGNPNDAKWPLRTSSNGLGKFNKSTDYKSHYPDIYLVHGALYQNDANANKAIAAKIKTTGTISVPNSSHVVFYDLLKRGLLSELLSQTVLAPKKQPGRLKTQLNISSQLPWNVKMREQ